MQELHAALLTLQDLDDEIGRAQARIDEFAPRIAELEAPATAVRQELQTMQQKLDEMRTEHARLQTNAQQKEERMHSYQERLERVRTSREEAALRAEIDLVRGALDADRDDLEQLAQQITRADLKVDELQVQFDRAEAGIAEERDALLQARAELETEVAVLADRRENHAVRLDKQSRRLYERVRGQHSRRVVAPMTDEGACGNCFNILPLQEQADVRAAAALRRCEACGVILYTG